MTLSLPPFTKAVTWLLGINTGIFLLMELLGADSVAGRRIRRFILAADGRFMWSSHGWRCGSW